MHVQHWLEKSKDDARSHGVVTATGNVVLHVYFV